MANAAAYVRMSTEHQKYSIENQLAEITAYCVLEGLTISQVYTDAGRSGLRVANRPGLRSLLQDAQSGGADFDVLVVLDVSRWGRFQNVDEGAYYEHLLHLAGIRMVYCAEPFENDDSPAMTIIKSVKRAMAAEYSRELSKKVSAGSRRVASKGFRCGGQAGYGFRRVILDEGGQVVQAAEIGEWKTLQGGRTTLRLGPPEEVAAVRRLFQLYLADDLLLNEIAEVLNREGWPKPSLRGWHKQRIQQIVGNEKYAGTNVYGRTVQPLASKRKSVHHSNWIRVEDAHPAIVSRRTFEAAAALRTTVRPKSTRQEMIDGLQRIYATYGTVTRTLIRDTPHVSGVTTVRVQFGSLAKAYAAANLPIQSSTAKRLIRLAATRQKPPA